MRVTIEVEIPDGSSEYTFKELLFDALASYQMVTGPTALQHVDERYPLGSYSRTFRERKLAELTEKRNYAYEVTRILRETLRITPAGPDISSTVKEYINGTDEHS